MSEHVAKKLAVAPLGAGGGGGGSAGVPTLTFVTGNAKKLEEVRQILAADAAGGAAAAALPFAIVSRKLDLPELQGASPR